MAKRPAANLATREAFFNSANALKRETVDVEGIGRVCIRELNGKQILRYNERIKELKAKDPDVNPANALELVGLLLTMSVCDKDDKLMFSEEDTEALTEISFEKLSFLARKIMTLSGLDPVRAREVADNLKKALDSSITGSPRSSESP